MKKIKKITAIFSVLVMMMTMCLTPVSAHVCSGVKGNLKQEKFFTISVGNSIWSSNRIVLTQQKGTTEQVLYNRTKYVDKYGRYYVTVYDSTSGSYVYSNALWKDKTFTISSSKLKRNHMYEITVRGDMKQYVGDSYSHAPYVFKSWKSYPTWKVSSAGGNIAGCGY